MSCTSYDHTDVPNLIHLLHRAHHEAHARAAAVDSDGFTTHGILMDYLAGYVPLASLPQLRPEHLAAAASTVYQLHEIGFRHGDLHSQNILVKAPQDGGQAQTLRNWVGQSLAEQQVQPTAVLLDLQSAKRWALHPTGTKTVRRLQ